MNAIEKIMRTAPVIPVLVIEDAGEAREIAEALVEGGLKVLEVTLRTEHALDVIRRMNLVRGAIVGAGTVTNKDQLDAALSAGAEFIVSPGLTEPLGRAAIKAGTRSCPALPRRATSCAAWTWGSNTSSSSPPWLLAASPR
jgi:2-dehydro-3-deoxyphosphogluconate aldolase / (4S)-4-hydroxy-2-oxoglutarate aldolase